MKKCLSLFFLIGSLSIPSGATQSKRYTFKECHNEICNVKTCQENQEIAQKCVDDCWGVSDCKDALKRHGSKTLSETAKNAHELRDNLPETAKKRLDKAREGEKDQDFGQNIYADLLKGFGVSLSLNPATATQGKMLRSAVFATQILGNLIGATIRGEGRKTIEEQIIESVDELLIRVVEKDLRDVESLVEKIENISSKRDNLFIGESPADKLKTVISMEAWTNTIKDLLDKIYLTNFKGDDAKELTEIRSHLITKEAELKDHIQLFFIKVIEGEIKKIDEKLNPVRMIEKLEDDILFYGAENFEQSAFEEKVNFFKITMNE